MVDTPVTQESISFALAKQTEDRVHALAELLKTFDDTPSGVLFEEGEIKRWAMICYMALRAAGPLRSARAIAELRSLEKAAESWSEGSRIQTASPEDDAAVEVEHVKRAALAAIRTYHASLEGLRGPVEGYPEEVENLTKRIEELGNAT